MSATRSASRSRRRTLPGAASPTPPPPPGSRPPRPHFPRIRRRRPCRGRRRWGDAERQPWLVGEHPERLQLLLAALRGEPAGEQLLDDRRRERGELHAHFRRCRQHDPLQGRGEERCREQLRRLRPHRPDRGRPGRTSREYVAADRVGDAAGGGTLSGSRGSWANNPSDFNYFWLRCGVNQPASSCSTIGGANGASYTLTSADVGNTIRFKVEAKNAAGSSFADSAPTARIAAAPAALPANTSPPTVSGTPQVGGR